MRVLLTGAFGNVGTSVLRELIARGHTVRCFDLQTKANRRMARQLGSRVEVVWGDLRNPRDVSLAVQDQEVVVHLAFIIPKMSITGIESENRPDWAREVNVGGTLNLVRAMEALPKPPKLIFASSYHIYGRTQDQRPPRTVRDPVRPTEHYAHHKVECEQIIRSSKLEWAILRLAATLPIAVKLDPGMFDVPLNNRMEFVHTRDVGLAIGNAVSGADVWERVWLIGGGPRCQYYFREIVERILDSIGVGMLPEEAFASMPFCTDWLDTTGSQEVLCYQQRDLGDYIQDMKAAVGGRRYLVQLLRPVVRAWLLHKSPHYRRPRGQGMAVSPQDVQADGTP